MALSSLPWLKRQWQELQSWLDKGLRLSIARPRDSSQLWVPLRFARRAHWRFSVRLQRGNACRGTMKQKKQEWPPREVYLPHSLTTLQLFLRAPLPGVIDTGIICTFDRLRGIVVSP
jgi:hypothetical protein